MKIVCWLFTTVYVPYMLFPQLPVYSSSLAYSFQLSPFLNHPCNHFFFFRVFLPPHLQKPPSIFIFLVSGKNVMWSDEFQLPKILLQKKFWPMVVTNCSFFSLTPHSEVSMQGKKIFQISGHVV